MLFCFSSVDTLTEQQGPLLQAFALFLLSRITAKEGKGGGALRDPTAEMAWSRLVVNPTTALCVQSRCGAHTNQYCLLDKTPAN